MTITIRRAALGVAGLALTMGSLTACGGDSDTDAAAASAAPTGDTDASDDASEEASEEASDDANDEASDDAGETPDDDPSNADSADGSADEFCGIYANLFETMTASFGQGGGDVSTFLPELKKYAEQLQDAGLPDGASADVKAGFELSTQALDGVSDDATEQDLLAAAQDYTAKEQAQATAFGQYVITTCPDLVPALPTQ